MLWRLQSAPSLGLKKLKISCQIPQSFLSWAEQPQFSFSGVPRRCSRPLLVGECPHVIAIHRPFPLLTPPPPFFLPKLSTFSTPVSRKQKMGLGSHTSYWFVFVNAMTNIINWGISLGLLLLRPTGDLFTTIICLFVRLFVLFLYIHALITCLCPFWDSIKLFKKKTKNEYSQ